MMSIDPIANVHVTSSQSKDQESHKSKQIASSLRKYNHK